MEELKHQDGCTSELFETKIIGNNKIDYCMECGQRKINRKDCIHDYVHVLFKISNGSLSLRRFCKLCYDLTPNAESQANHDLTKIQIKSLEEYRTWIDSRRQAEKQEMSSLIESLEFRKIRFRRDEYAEYLKSDWWKTIRNRIIKRDSKTCQICFGPAEDVHHLTYRHKGNEFMFELISLCKKCHLDHYHSEINNLND